MPQARASLRLLTSPACEQARSAGCAVGRVRKRVAQPRRPVVGARVIPTLLERDVRGRVAHEEQRHRKAEDRDRSAAGDQDVARNELARKPAAGGGGERNPAVAGGLVQAEREAAALGADEIDLHHHRHRPGESLVDAEEDVGDDDPSPARGDGDQERNRQGGSPADDQQTPPPDAFGEDPGTRGW